jgi:hypothetical protein
MLRDLQQAGGRVCERCGSLLPEWLSARFCGECSASLQKAANDVRSPGQSDIEWVGICPEDRRMTCDYCKDCGIAHGADVLNYRGPCHHRWEKIVFVPRGQAMTPSGESNRPMRKSQVVERVLDMLVDLGAEEEPVGTYLSEAIDKCEELLSYYDRCLGMAIRLEGKKHVA